MNRTENRDPRDRTLTTADLAAAGRQRPSASDDESIDDRDDRMMRSDEMTQRDEARRMAPQSEQLEPLFQTEVADGYRSRWADIQSGFVDDPRRAAQQGDELVAQVMQTLAENFAHEREHLERELSQTGEASTEALRVALRRYRSFFERLLSL